MATGNVGSIDVPRTSTYYYALEPDGMVVVNSGAAPY